MAALALASPRPHTVTAIDIEELVQWAIARSIPPRLRVPSARELMLNPYDVKVRGIPNEFHGGGIEIEAGRPADDIDADRVLRAIDRLDPWTGSIVRANARTRRRPDWMEGVEPRLIEKPTWSRKGRRKGKRRGRRKDKPVVLHTWEPCSPAAICATREIYSRWHAGMTRLIGMLGGTLLRYQINGFAAPVAPWETALEKSA